MGGRGDVEGVITLLPTFRCGRGGSSMFVPIPTPVIEIISNN